MEYREQKKKEKEIFDQVSNLITLMTAIFKS